MASPRKAKLSKNTERGGRSPGNALRRPLEGHSGIEGTEGKEKGSDREGGVRFREKRGKDQTQRSLNAKKEKRSVLSVAEGLKLRNLQAQPSYVAKKEGAKKSQLLYKTSSKKNKDTTEYLKKNSSRVEKNKKEELTSPRKTK